MGVTRGSGELRGSNEGPMGVARGSHGDPRRQEMKIQGSFGPVNVLRNVHRSSRCDRRSRCSRLCSSGAGSEEAS